MEFPHHGFSAEHQSSVNVKEGRAMVLTHTTHALAYRKLVHSVCSLSDLAEVLDSKEEQQSEGSSVVMVPKLIKWREVMGIGFKPLATFLPR